MTKTGIDGGDDVNLVVVMMIMIDMNHLQSIRITIEISHRCSRKTMKAACSSMVVLSIRLHLLPHLPHRQTPVTA